MKELYGGLDELHLWLASSIAIAVYVNSTKLTEAESFYY